MVRNLTIKVVCAKNVVVFFKKHVEIGGLILFTFKSQRDARICA